MSPRIILDENPEESEVLVALTLNITLQDCSQVLLIFHTLVTAILAYSCIPLYLSVFLLFIVKRKAFDLADVFTFAIMLGNFIIIISHSSVIPISSLLKRWPFGEFLCAFTGNAYLVGYDIRYMSLIALSLHRFCGFLSPFRYPRYSKLVVALLVAIITLYLTATRIWYIWYSVIFFDVTWPCCDSQTDPVHLHSTVTRVRIVVWGLFYMVGICPFIFYAIMWHRARKIIANMMASSISVESMAVEKRKKEKKGLQILLIVLLTGIPNITITYLKITTGSAMLGLSDAHHALTVHFILTQITLISPYFDIIFLVFTSKEKKEMTLKFLKIVKHRLSYGTVNFAKLII